MKKKQKTLTKTEIQKTEKKFPHWKLEGKGTKFSHIFHFEKQIDGLIFIARITVNAEILKHHPDITFSYQKIKVTTTTHEVKGLTKLDVSLMTRVEEIAQSQKVDKE